MTKRILNLLLVTGLLAVWIYLRGAYNEVTSRIHLPEEFEHMIYRVIVAFLVVETIKGLIFIFYRPADPRKRKDNFTIGVNHISTILYGLFMVALLLSILNISIKEAITTLSLIAAAVVLMTKDYISNLINGMYLTFAKVITIGDQVQIEGHKGKIVDITLTNVHMINEDDDLIYMPNNLVFSKEIINYTRRELKKTSIDFEVATGIVKEVSVLEKKLVDALEPFHGDIQPDSFVLKVTAVKFEYTQFKFQYIMRDHNNRELEKKIRRFIIREVVRLTTTGFPIN